MNEENKETQDVMRANASQEIQAEGDPRFSYQRYQAIGGRINEDDYSRVMQQVSNTPPGFTPDKLKVSQCKSIEIAVKTLSLDNLAKECGVDPLLVYEILRNDIADDGVVHHHCQMSDQEILVEALRMLEQAEAAKLIIDCHKNINFN